MVPDESEQLCKEIEQVKQEESDDNKFFDDNFQEKDELYNQASEVLKVQDIQNNQDVLKLEDIDI